MRFLNITEQGALDVCHILVAVDDYETHHINRVLVIFFLIFFLPLIMLSKLMRGSRVQMGRKLLSLSVCTLKNGNSRQNHEQNLLEHA